MKKTEKLARRLYRFLEDELESFPSDGDKAWISDNKNRILALAASLARMCTPRLPAGSEAPRVFELAQELVEQCDGAVTFETLRLARRFSLTFAEFDWLGTFIQLNEVRLLVKIMRGAPDLQAFIPNCVKTLITFGELDFDALREECLPQEELLLRDRTYADSDRATRARYRAAAARLARKSKRTETEICAMALEQNDVTDAFFGAGAALLCQRLGLRPPRKASVFLYLLSGFLPAAAACGALCVLCGPAALFSLLPLSVVLFRLLHRFLLRRTVARRPLRLAESCADAKENKTVVVLTVLLSSEKSACKALDTLEEHAAGNPLKHGAYAILADLKESASEEDEADEAILAVLRDGIDRLNRAHGSRFAALVRTRSYYEGIFTGRERKRGALEDLVAFLSGDGPALRLAHNADVLHGAAYLCTLDADTVLPPGSLVRLLSVAAHPFNRDAGLIQPRITTLSPNETPFARLFAFSEGLDAYDTPAREVFWDVFASGSFCGKGLFSVKAYRARVSGRIRPGTVLSHDLLEGELLGTLAANDVSFFDAFPEEPIAYYKRRERWLRGDWLLVRWLFSPLGALSKWKIFWNLLLSLFPVGVLFQLCAAFFSRNHLPLALFLPLAEILLPILETYGDALRFDREKHLFSDKRGDRLHRVTSSLAGALFLPFEAFDSLRAVCRTAVRMAVGRRILEWTPFSARADEKKFSAYLRFFLPGTPAAFLPLACALIAGTGLLPALLSALLWFPVPYYAFLLGRKKQNETPVLKKEQEHDLRLLALRTLRFFDDALCENDYWMPDHLLCAPTKKYALRTSPTNLGFALLSVPCGTALNAYAPSRAIRLLRAQCDRIAALPRWHGHLYNWISLKTKRPLTPYVSTVDSGNYTASLLAVAGALPSLKTAVLTDPRVCRGIADTIEACLDEAQADFRIVLEEYARAFASAGGARALTLTRRFLSDKILQSCEAARFALACAKDWFRDADALRFSDSLIARIEEQNEFNLRPLKEFLAQFPLSIQDVLALPDFEETLSRLVWREGQTRFHALLDEVREEYRKLYSYAFLQNEEIDALASRLTREAEQTDFACLYDAKRELLCIGKDTEKPGRKTGYYDMLVSEARLTSFVAIALNKIPPRHWFRPARPFARYRNAPLCLSWSGTMFEYLMPELFFLPSPASMLSVSSSLACAAQRACAGHDGLWGVSESAYCVTDRSGEYRYKAFGVPRTALSAAPFERVFAPYATLLALERTPRAAYANVIRFVENGMAGRYGLFEALDREHCENGIVRSHMAHHQGMSLCALTNFLCEGFVRKSFCASRNVSACSLLWEEKMPLGVLPRRTQTVQKRVDTPEETFRDFAAPDKQDAEALLLAGSSLHALVSSKGKTEIYCGKIFCGELRLYTVGDKTGSISFDPVRDKTGDYHARFEPGRAVFERRDASVLWCQETVVSAESAHLALRVSACNEGASPRRVRVWAYLRPVLDQKDAFEAHKCFHDLFLSARAEPGALTVTNRRTGMSACLSAPPRTRFTSDRASFFGRGASERHPLGDFSGAVRSCPVTPCMAAEYELTLKPGEESVVTFLYSFGTTPEEARAARPVHPAAVERMRERALLSARAFLREKRLSREEWVLSLRLAALCAQNAVPQKGEKRKDTLWRLSLPDRLPLLTICVSAAQRARLESFLRVVDYLLARGLCFAVAVIDDAAPDYFDTPFRQTEKLLERLCAADAVRHVRASDADTEALRRLSFAFLSSDDVLPRASAPWDTLASSVADNPYPPSVIAPEEGEFDCGYGCFLPGGDEYAIRARTPAPWSNLLVNAQFGTLVTESGGGFTWQNNAALNKLTPWSDDPVTERQGEMLYLRDDKLGRFWSITRDPIDMGDDHVCVFGHGYARWRYDGFGLKQELTVFVHPTRPLKVWDLSLPGASSRALTLYLACFPQMGEREDDARFVSVCEREGMICAEQNGAYYFLYAPGACYASSEYAFFGDGTPEDPLAVRRGAFCAPGGGKPLLALSCGANERVTLYAGYAQNEQELRLLRGVIDRADPTQWLSDVRRHFDNVLTRVRIRTPDKKLDLLFNHWFMYQTICSRLLGRCGFYQAGGAFGFRDQLQDCLSLLYVDPAAVRRHLLVCAAHQFPEGDVQHWWHPPRTGVRTHISDDLLFLPLVAARYAAHTGDRTVWDEVVPFLEGRAPGEREDLYETARESEERGTLFDHCLRAIRLVMRRTGAHGLPLILGGDWNDGLNELGKKGTGESVWLGWFAYHVISCILPEVKKRSPRDADAMLAYARSLVGALNHDAWDGAWFLRAFNDEGEPVGSRKNAHGRIDAVSQAWAVLSGAAEPEKAKTALESARRELLDTPAGLYKLLTPPFEKSDCVGYVGEYLPGVRENGGQYTHAALWTASAFAQCGDGETCRALLDMLNPLSHTANRPAAAHYRLEPYSVPADVYAGENAGRGGWSWYTASSSLFFTVTLEDLLGVKKENGVLTLSPHIPSSWRAYTVTLTENGHVTEINVRNPDGKTEGTPVVTRQEKDGKTVLCARL